MDPLTVSWLTSTAIVLGRFRLIVPTYTFVPVRFSSVPPLRASASLTVIPPWSWRVAPDATRVPAAVTTEAFVVAFTDSWVLFPPRAELFWMFTVPARMFVWAVYVFVPVRVTVPAPALVNDRAGLVAESW